MPLEVLPKSHKTSTLRNAKLALKFAKAVAGASPVPQLQTIFTIATFIIETIENAQRVEEVVKRLAEHVCQTLRVVADAYGDPKTKMTADLENDLDQFKDEIEGISKFIENHASQTSWERLGQLLTSSTDADKTVKRYTANLDHAREMFNLKCNIQLRLSQKRQEDMIASLTRIVKAMGNKQLAAAAPATLANHVRRSNSGVKAESDRKRGRGRDSSAERRLDGGVKDEDGKHLQVREPARERRNSDSGAKGKDGEKASKPALKKQKSDSTVKDRYDGNVPKPALEGKKFHKKIEGRNDGEFRKLAVGKKSEGKPKDTDGKIKKVVVKKASDSKSKDSDVNSPQGKVPKAGWQKGDKLPPANLERLNAGLEKKVRKSRSVDGEEKAETPPVDKPPVLSTSAEHPKGKSKRKGKANHRRGASALSADILENSRSSDASDAFDTPPVLIVSGS